MAMADTGHINALTFIFKCIIFAQFNRRSIYESWMISLLIFHLEKQENADRKSVRVFAYGT